MGKTFRRDSDGHSWERESNRIKRVKKPKNDKRKVKPSSREDYIDSNEVSERDMNNDDN